MSKAISGFLTSLAWGVEANQGTEAATFPYLWNSEESDSLSFGESPFDQKPLTGARGQTSTSYRVVQNLPGGDLGAAPIIFGTDSTQSLQLLLAHFQQVTESGASAPYTYSFSPVTDGIDEGNFNTISISKNTGIDGAAHLYTGCVVDALNISWEQGGVLSWVPSIKAMESDYDDTAPTTPSVATGGFMQAPNINITWNGTEIHPSSFSIDSMNNYPDRQSGDARGRYNYVVGDYTGAVNLSVWRDDSSADHWVNPFYSETLGTLAITATMDTSYGTITGGNAVTLTYTAYCRVEMPNDMPGSRDDVVDDVVLRTMNNTALPILTITAESTGLVS